MAPREERVPAARCRPRHRTPWAQQERGHRGFAVREDVIMSRPGPTPVRRRPALPVRQGYNQGGSTPVVVRFCRLGGSPGGRAGGEVSEMGRFCIAMFLVAVSVSLVACGGGGEEAATPTVPEQTASPVTGTPTDAFTITGNTFESEARGYRVSFPAGWTPRPDFLPAPGIAVDAFFAPDVIDEIQPNIAVTCEELREERSVQAYFDAKMDRVRKVAQVEPETGSREVGGMEALTAHYRRENAQPPHEKTEVFLMTEGCGWNISLTVPQGRGAEYEGTFEDFLDSFSFVQ